MVVLKKRNLWGMLFLLIITCGLYYIYWLYKTKEEINELGASIPPLWFTIIPFVNFYFYYRYAQDFTQYIKKTYDDWGLVIGYSALLIFLPVLSIFIIQYELNHYKNDGVRIKEGARPL